MIATPETGVDSIAVTYALLDPVMTVVRPVAAFFTAFFTGLLVNICIREETPSEPDTPNADLKPLFLNVYDQCCTSQEISHRNTHFFHRVKHKLHQGMSFAFGDLLSDIGPWLLAGIVLSGCISVFVSPEFVATYLGDGLFSMLMMIVVATPLYVCATASTPIAAAMALKGLSPGAALVFLLAGPATNAATITVVARLLGKKTAALYVISIMICSLGLGLVVNIMYQWLGLDIISWVSSESHASHGLFAVFCTLLLVALIGRAWFIKHRFHGFVQKAKPQHSISS